MFSCIFLTSFSSAKYKLVGRLLVLYGNISLDIMWFTVVLGMQKFIRIFIWANRNLMHVVLQGS